VSEGKRFYDPLAAADVPRVRAFGRWDAPITDGADWIDVPLGRMCVWCREPFQPGDSGAIMPAGHAEHKECSLRNVMGGIGHHVNHARYCHGELGPDAGLSRRKSAMLVWGLIVERLVVTEFDLDNLRGDPQWTD
jgi:hypothetical protein